VVHDEVEFWEIWKRRRCNGNEKNQRSICSIGQQNDGRHTDVINRDAYQKRWLGPATMG